MFDCSKFWYLNVPPFCLSVGSCRVLEAYEWLAERLEKGVLMLVSKEF